MRFGIAETQTLAAIDQSSSMVRQNCSLLGFGAGKGSGCGGHFSWGGS